MLELKKAHPHINGTMMAVGADKRVVQPLITPIRRRRNSGVLTVACENSPEYTTVAGNVSAIDDLAEVLEAQGKLRLSYWIRAEIALLTAVSYGSKQFMRATNDAVASSSFKETEILQSASPPNLCALQ